MDSGVCPVCGERNPPGTEFCRVCQTYLGWDKIDSQATESTSSVRSQGSGGSGQEVLETQFIPRVTAETTPATQPDADPNDLVADDRFRVATEKTDVTVSPTGEPAELEVRVSNISIRVDGYVAEAPGAPEWLNVKSTPVELLPGTDEMLRIRFNVASARLVPAQQIPVTVRIRAMNEPLAFVDLSVAVTVSVVEAPLQLRAEPRLLRVQDRPDAAFTLTLDNTYSNRPVRAELAGTDPELAVRFSFDPAVVEIGPSGTATVRVSVSAEQPAAGQEASRALTVTAREGSRSVETPVTFVQISSVQVEDPPVGLQVEPALIRTRDNPVGLTRVLVDNSNGRDWAHVQLAGSDPEQVVYVSFDSPQLHVPPGQTAQTQVRLHAPLPPLGSDVTRTVTLTATDARKKTSSVTATLVQAASASPMTTLGVRIEPEVTRAHDADGASVQVVLDNRRGQFRVRLQLNGSDPERAVGFAFASPVVDVEPGQVRNVELRLGAWRPAPGQEVTRQFTVSASDGQDSVQASASLVQTSSRSAMETLALRIDPSVLRLERRRRGMVSALVDNRNGAQPVRVTLTGDDPENCIRFSFVPNVVEVPAGRISRATVRVDAPGVSGPQEVTRSIMVVASDGRAEVQATGTLVQIGAERRPLARVLFTLFGALLMIIGSLMAWETGGTRGHELTANLIANQFGFQLDLGRFDFVLRLVSVGVAEIVLAIVMVFGLTGRSGRLTRLAAFVGAVLVVGTFVTLFVAGSVVVPAIGAIVVVVGCVLGYVGGLLVKR